MDYQVATNKGYSTDYQVAANKADYNFDAARARKTAEVTRQIRRREKFEEMAATELFAKVINEITEQATDGKNSAEFTAMPYEYYNDTVKSGHIPDDSDCHFSAKDKEVFDVLESMMDYKVHYESHFPAMFETPTGELLKVDIDLVKVYW